MRDRLEDDATMTTRAINQIKVIDRHRRDFGDLAALARSIDDKGLLQPIAITPDDILIAGERRLRAWPLTRFKDEPIPVHVVDLEQIVRGEWAENADRKDFTLSEIVAITKALEPLLATPRGRPAKEISATCANKPKGKTTEKVAAYAGVSARTIEKAKAIVEAAEADPGRYGKLLETMDRQGRANGPYKRLRVIKQSDAIRNEPPPLPNRGPYRTIVADVPWPSEPEDESPSDRGRAYYPYPTMSIAQLCALPIEKIAHKDSWLWFWATNFHLLGGYATKIIRAWGFEPVTMRTWVKDHFGQGQILRGKTEHVILAKRGNPVINLTNETTELRGRGGEHSEKPATFYFDVENLCPASRYAELFARRKLPDNWDGHGDQVGTIAEVAALPPHDLNTGEIIDPAPSARIERTKRNADGTYAVIFSEVTEPCCRPFRAMRLSNGTTALMEVATEKPAAMPIDLTIPDFCKRPVSPVSRVPSNADSAGRDG